LLNFDN
jgi:hypothetical protein